MEIDGPTIIKRVVEMLFMDHHEEYDLRLPTKKLDPIDCSHFSLQEIDRRLMDDKEEHSLHKVNMLLPWEYTLICE